jgi:hypothetical protein
MKRITRVSLGLSVLLTGLFFGIPVSSVAAMSDNGSSTSSCTSGYPAPYTSGAPVAKYYYLSDGSTVTITSTGAVIKQGRCGNAYREGWINPADICTIQSAQDLNGGRLSSGSSNPYGSAGYNGCEAKPQTTTKTVVTTPTQTQSQSITINNPQPAVKAATTTQTTSAVAATKTLPNTGPGNILMLSGATSAIGTLGHYYYSRRNRR